MHLVLAQPDLDESRISEGREREILWEPVHEKIIADVSLLRHHRWRLSTGWPPPHSTKIATENRFLLSANLSIDLVVVLVEVRPTRLSRQESKAETNRKTAAKDRGSS